MTNKDIMVIEVIASPRFCCKGEVGLWKIHFSKPRRKAILLIVTIASRRRIYWGLFLAACACLVTAIALAIPVFAARGVPKLLKAAGAYQGLSLFGIKLDSCRAAASGVLLAALFSTLCLGYILTSFRKTVSSEIFFFAFWVLSLSIEVGRLFIYRFAVSISPLFWTIVASKVVLGGRIVGLLSFFAAGLYAAGFRNEKLGSAVALFTAAGWAIAYSMPIDSGVYEPILLMKLGYAGLSTVLAVIAGIAIVANFVYASFSTGEASYRAAAIGAALALLGQRLLVSQWHPIALALGAALLVLGSWLFVSRLHAYYLWQ